MNARRRTRPLFAALAILLCVISRASAQEGIPQPVRSGPTLGPPPSRSRTPVITVSDASIDRVHDWLEAIGDHTPGEYDAALATIASWRRGDLQTLWINTTVLIVMMDDLRSQGFSLSVGGLTFGKQNANRFTIKPDGQPEVEIQYRPVQLRRLKLYACAAVGTTFCPESLKFAEPPLGLERLSQQMRLNILDGAAVDDVEIPIHWIMGRLLQDDVIPAGSKKPAPGRDAEVRDWYRATAAWMQDRESHDTTHLDRARELFPRDAGILFLSGCQREAFAAPRIHAALGAAVVPPGFGFDIGSDRGELRRAEEYFRRALDVDPGMAEGHLHLARVLLARKEYKDAVDHLRRASPLGDDQLEYYQSLFLGAAEAGLAHDEAARTAYRRAAALRPEAQSPLIALSELATRRGDRLAALRELQRVFALPPYAPERDDPWWDYFTSHVRNAEALVERLRAEIAGEDKHDE